MANEEVRASYRMTRDADVAATSPSMEMVNRAAQSASFDGRIVDLELGVALRKVLSAWMAAPSLTSVQAQLELSVALAHLTAVAYGEGK